MRIARRSLRPRLACAFALACLVVAVDASAQEVAATPHSTVVAPSVVTHVDAVYPVSALATREHADVLLAVTVDADGHVSKVEVLRSAAPDLDEAAIIAARQWTFHPALRDGRPVASRIRIPFHFAPPAPAPEVIETAKPNQLDTQQASQRSPSPAPGAAAPDAAQAEASTAEDVNVRGHLQARSHGVSDYQVEVGELKAVPRTNASDALKLAPGFLLTNEGGSGHAEQVFLRGFDAHEGQDLEFTVDGVPINDSGNYHGNGYADTHFIIPELIHSVRVLEGPYAPQQGDFAVAGSADYQLGLDRRGLTTEYTTGSFDTQRLLLLWGPSDAPSGTFAGAEYFTTNGFGVNRQARRGTAMGQYELPVGDRGTLRINATAYVTEYNNAGIVREDDYDSGKVGFYGTEDPNQTGNSSSRASISATYETRYRDIDVSQQLFVIDRTMRLRENWTGYIDDIQLPTQQPHDQRGDLIDFHFDGATIGGRGLARWHGSAFGQRQEFEAGYYARVDQTTSQQYRIAAGSNTPYLTDADLTSTLGDVAVYVDGNVHFAPWLALRGGVRGDMFLFDVLNNCAVHSADNPSKASPEIDTPCLSELEHGVYREPFQRATTGDGAIMPRGTLALGPFDHFEFTASVGDGIRSVDPSYVSQGLQTPFIRVQSRDLGTSYTGDLGRSVGLTAKSVFFQTHVDQDLLFDPTAGRNALADGTTRTGWAGSLRALGSFFDVSANATLVKATFDDTHLLVPYVPDIVLRADAALFRELPWRLDHKPVRATLGYGVSYVGRRPLPYGELSDTIFLSDASLGLGWSIWNVRLVGQNLFDARYKLGEYNYASDFHSAPAPTLVPERSFTAGAPQQILLSLSATLGGA
jgi:iron complex outermembrane receptor protein